MSDPDVFEWQLADVLTNESALFILWAIKTLFCTRREDFLREYAFDPQELDTLLRQLHVTNFLQDDGTELVLTNAGNIAVAQLDTTPAPPATTNLARPAEDIEARFNVPKERIYVEDRLMEQLKMLGWYPPHGSGPKRDPETPYVQSEGRRSYHDVLLKDSLKRALFRLNRDEGMPALTNEQCDEAIQELKQVQPVGSGLIEANQRAMKLLLEGVDVSNPPDAPGGAYRRLRVIDTDNPDNNECLVLNQFRIQLPGEERFIIPDVVLFVNGIPLVVIECKSPEVTDPIESAVAQLQRYADAREGVPALFHFNLFLVATCYYTAKVGTLGVDSQDYHPWKDHVQPYPRVQMDDAGVYFRQPPRVAESNQGFEQDLLSSQQMLVEGMLRIENLLDLLKNFVLFDSRGGHTVKIIPRYQQYRAVQKALERLDLGKIKTVHNDDERGGIIWHTQGSGKSLTMVFLIRKMRTLKHLKKFKIVVVTDRQDLQDQLKSTMKLTGDDLRIARDIPHMVGHNLLQAIARVNRTYPDKTYGLIVDYLGVARQLKEALLVYRAGDIQGALIDIRDEMLKLEARHQRLKAMFSEKGIEIGKISLKRDQEIIDALLNLCKEPRFRADFEEKLKKFMESMDAVWPRPEAFPYVHDMNVLGYVNKCLANFLPEEQIDIKGTGKKVRDLINEHITVLGISQTVAPISIVDPDFESKIDAHVSDETKASQMEHLAKYYIKEHYDEDPEYYERLSERLEEILKRFKEQWSQLVVALLPYIHTLREGRQGDPTGLDTHTQLPFMDILEIEASRGSGLFGIEPNENSERRSRLTPEQRKELAMLTKELVETIRNDIKLIEFWNRQRQVDNLTEEIIRFLDENKLIEPYQRQNAVADRLIHLARRLHPWLTAS